MDGWLWTFDKDPRNPPVCGLSLCDVGSLRTTLNAVIHEDESGGFWAEVPSLPGCVTQGESLAEIKINIREAVEAWLEAAEPDPALEESAQIFEIAV